MTEHVPSVAELAHLGLADVIHVKGQPQAYKVSDAGHALMGEAMRANALAALERGEGRWTRPISNGVPLGTLIHPEGQP